MSKQRGSNSRTPFALLTLTCGEPRRTSGAQPCGEATGRSAVEGLQSFDSPRGSLRISSAQGCAINLCASLRGNARSWLLGLVLLGIAGTGCGHCEDHEGAKIRFDLAEFNYQNGKFDQAKILYGKTLEMCEDYEGALLGLANACREYGNDQFRGAADMASQNKLQEARRIFDDARDNHVMSLGILQKLMKENSGDVAPHYALGLMYYQRATSVYPFPHQINDKVNRQRERDQAIAEFKIVLDREPRAYQAHRYQGLALFAAGRMDEGRYHLKRYHDAQQVLYEKIMRWPNFTDEEKARKEMALSEVEREMAAIREVLGERFMELSRDRDILTAKKDRKPEETQQLATIAREILELESALKHFRLIQLGPIEMAVRERCQEYLDRFNRGSLPDILPYLAPPSGQEAAVQQAIQDKVQLGTKYQRLRYRTIVVQGDTASVGLVCDVTTSKGNKPETEMTFRWRLVGGQWKVSDHP